MDEDDPLFYWDSLTRYNLEQIDASIEEDLLYMIVSSEDGGIIAYAIGEDHAKQVVEALTAAASKP